MVAIVSEETSWSVYIVSCQDGTLYTGIAKNLERRIKAHNQGVGAKYTRSRLPVTLVYQERADSRSGATKRELAIKRLSRNAKKMLIAEQAT